MGAHKERGKRDDPSGASRQLPFRRGAYMEQYMDRKGNRELVPLARNLRKEMTREERKLWYQFLRLYPVRFYRQKVLGRYIADFYCAKAKLVIELDGSQHYEEKGQEKDALRTRYLEGYDLKVLRIANNQVTENFEGVCSYIDRIVKQRIGDEV